MLPSWDLPRTSPCSHPAPAPLTPVPSTQQVQKAPCGGAGWGGGWLLVAHRALSLPSHCSAAGEFFPEAAQVAYRMWELSAVAKVEVSTLPAPPSAPRQLGIPGCFSLL